MKVWNLINDNNNAAPNQFVFDVPKGYVFQSYDSMIAFYDLNTNKVYITEDWEYSNTTRKHFYMFLRDYCGACGQIRKKDVQYEIKQGNYVLVDKIKFSEVKVSIKK